MTKTLTYLFMTITSVVVMNSCKPDNLNLLTEDFDRAPMLENIADNIIVPAYRDFEAKIITLRDDAALIVGGGQTELDNARASWKEALLAWQNVAMFEFGPGLSVSQRAQFNIYPTNVTTITSNIAVGGYDLDWASNLDAKGLQAVDYLLYGLGATDQDIVDAYNVVVDSPERGAYLLDVCEDMVLKANTIVTGWTGGYADFFKGNSGNVSIGSSTSLLVNSINMHFEAYVRKGKIGLPSGVFNGFSQQPMPDHVEAYYYGQSLGFGIESMRAYGKLIMGEHFGSTDFGPGLDQYMNFVDANIEGTNLSYLINGQVAVVIQELENLNDPLSNEVITKQQDCIDVFYAMQKLVAYFKTDMASSLGVLITYTDNDGD